MGTDWHWDGETVVKATDQLESSSFLICFQILLTCLHAWAHSKAANASN